MDFSSPNLDHAADWNRLVTAQIQHSFQDEVGIQAGGPKGGCITGLKRQGEQDAGVKGPVMIAVAGQDEAMCQCFGISGVRFVHARRIRRLPVRKVSCRDSHEPHFGQTSTTASRVAIILEAID